MYTKSCLRCNFFKVEITFLASIFVTFEMWLLCSVNSLVLSFTTVNRILKLICLCSAHISDKFYFHILVFWRKKKKKTFINKDISIFSFNTHVTILLFVVKREIKKTKSAYPRSYIIGTLVVPVSLSRFVDNRAEYR